MARRLAAGEAYSYWGGRPDAYVTPGFPLFLTLCMKIFGSDVYGLYWIKVVQGGLTALTVLLTFVLGKQLTKRYSAGLIACILVACNGAFPFLSRFLLTETLYYFTMMLFFVVFVYAWKKDTWWAHALAGALFCVSVMVRPLLAIVSPFLYLPLLWHRRQCLKKVLWCAVAFAGAFCLVALPWWIRNMVTLGRFVLFATQTNPIYAGLAPNVQALGLKDPGSFMGNIKLLFKLLWERPGGTLYWMTLGKFEIIFLRPIGVWIMKNLTTLATHITLYLGLLGAGIVLLLPKARWASVVFFVYLAASFAFVPSARYGLQYMPFLAIFTGGLITFLVEKIKESRAQALA
jgi:hypothetical protein